MQKRIKLNQGLRVLVPVLLCLGLAGGCSTDTELGVSACRMPRRTPGHGTAADPAGSRLRR